MKKVLIVTAHPSSKGFTHRIANAFKGGAISKGHEVEILDLYKTEHQIPFLNFEEKKDMANLSPTVLALQAKIAVVDELVFVHPLWWLGPPAILKNFLDNVLMPHFAYKYTPEGKRQGLLKGKNGRVFITCDGPMYLYLCMGLPFISTWAFAVLYFCGLYPKTFRVFDRSFKKTEEDRLAFLDKVKKIALSI